MAVKSEKRKWNFSSKKRGNEIPMKTGETAFRISAEFLQASGCHIASAVSIHLKSTKT